MKIKTSAKIIHEMLQFTNRLNTYKLPNRIYRAAKECYKFYTFSRYCLIPTCRPDRYIHILKYTQNTFVISNLPLYLHLQLNLNYVFSLPPRIFLVITCEGTLYTRSFSTTSTKSLHRVNQ